MTKGTNISNFLILSLFGIIASCNTNADKQQISLKNIQPKVISKKGAEIFQYWEFKNELYLWDTMFAQPPSLKLYQDSLNNILGKDTFDLVVQKLAYQNVSYKSIKTKNGDSINTQLIHTGSLGKIRPINYLEAQLLEYQISRYPLLSHPTEFHGLILVHDSLKLIRVYFAASDQPWPPKPGIILDAAKKDSQQGWVFKYHLHNHYEPKLNYYLGILAPSMTDAQYYNFLSEEYNLEQALITNGFHTVQIKKAEFENFMTPPSN